MKLLSKAFKSSPKINFIEKVEVVSKPGSTVTVKRLVLNDAGRKALSTDLKGIYEDAQGNDDRSRHVNEALTTAS